MTVDSSDEQIIRRAAKMVNDRLAEYQSKHKNLTTQEMLALVAFDCLISMQTSEYFRDKESNNTNEKIKLLNTIIDSAL